MLDMKQSIYCLCQINLIEFCIFEWKTQTRQGGFAESMPWAFLFDKLF